MTDHAILVTGSRYGWDRPLVEEIQRVFDDQCYNRGRVVVIEGEAAGVDVWARLAAVKLGFRVEPFLADWSRHGKKAGVLRNQAMIDRLIHYKKLDYHCWVHAWHPLGEEVRAIKKGSGTADAIRRAQKVGFYVAIHNGRG